MFSDGAEHSFKFTDEVEGGKGSGAKSMFRIDRLESDGAKTARDGNEDLRERVAGIRIVQL